MVSEWMPLLDLRLAPDEFRRLPRHPSYRYTYVDGVLWLSPSPRYYHAALDLRQVSLPQVAPVTVRPFLDTDWNPAADLFAAAFARQQPFAGLSHEARLCAAHQSMQRVRDDGDGPWIARASCVAETPGGELLGAFLVTLVPLSNPTDWSAYVWDEPPPCDALARRLGRPHLTWIFVNPQAAGRGIGTAMLAHAVRALRELGFDELHTTMLLGNDSSMLWHWRCGFRLLAYPGSLRPAHP